MGSKKKSYTEAIDELENDEQEGDQEDSSYREAEPFDTESRGGESKISDMARKVLTMGMGAAFMTEESLRQAFRESKLPKDFPPLKTWVDGALRAKQDLTQKVGDDIVRLLSKLDWTKEIAKFAQGHKFTIKAEIQVDKKPTSKKVEETDSDD